MNNKEMKYIDPVLIKIAKEQDVFEILIKAGEPMNKVAGVFRLREHDSLVITPSKGFYWFSQGIGSSNPIDFFVRVKGMSFIEATNKVLEVMDYDYSRRNVVVTSIESKNPNYVGREFELPKRAEHNRNVYAYLTKTRGLDKEIVKSLINKGLIYQDEKYNNAVFVGSDFDGNIVSAFKRSTNTNIDWKSDVGGSQKEFRFRVENPKSTVVNVFESEIDLLSYLSSIPEIARNENYISLGGVSDMGIMKFLENRQDIIQVNVCTDNDSKGNEFCKNLADKIGKEYLITRELSFYKDFNEDLVKGVEYDRNRIDVLVFSEETKTMARNDKIQYINDIFSKKYQGQQVQLEYPSTEIFDEIDRGAKINMRTKTHFRHQDKIENIEAFSNRLNIGVEKNLPYLLSKATYVKSQEERKAGQNQVHTKANTWHYFNKPFVIDDGLFNMVIDVRENALKQTYIHKIRLEEIEIGHIEKINRDLPQTPYSGVSKRGKALFDVSNDTTLHKESQEEKEKKQHKRFSFSRDNEIEF